MSPPSAIAQSTLPRVQRAQKYRVRLTNTQQKKFDLYAAAARWWWNRHIEYDRKHRQAIASGKFLPSREGTRGALRVARESGITFPYEGREIPIASVPATILYGASKQFDNAVTSYRALRKTNPNARPPSFRSKQGSQTVRWQVQDRTGHKASSTDLWRSPEGTRWRKVRGIGELNTMDVRYHRPLPEDSRVDHLIIKRDQQGRYWAIIPFDTAEYEPPTENGIVGIDRGVTRSLTLSDGRWIRFPGATPGETKRMRRLERTLARRRGNVRTGPKGVTRDPALKARCCRHDHWVGKKLVKGFCDGADCDCWKHSKRYARAKRELALLRDRIANRQADAEHKVTRIIARDYGTIILEDLRVQNMTRSAAGTLEQPGKNVAQKHGLNRAILGSGWTCVERHGYKFREIIKVPAAYTSQTCPECGVVAAANRKGSDYRCDCGCNGNADVVGAINIARCWTAGAQPVAARESLCSGTQPANARTASHYQLQGGLVPQSWGVATPLRAEPARIYADKDNLVQVVVNKDGEVMVWTRENQRAIWSPTILLEEKRS